MGSRLVAEYDPATSQYYYYTQDQIGSTRVVTNDAGTVVYAAAHDPYGGIQQTWANAFDPKRKFSDKERDEETGLDYFGARDYASGIYRWLSVDPIRTQKTQPCQWNLYSYCHNNPITYLDPNGKIEISFEVKLKFASSRDLEDWFGNLGGGIWAEGEILVTPKQNADGTWWDAFIPKSWQGWFRWNPLF